jgi:integrase
MGRTRKDGDPLGLAGTRLSFRHGAFYYRHRDGRWERVGTDLAGAKARAALYNDPAGVYGTTGYWLDLFLVDCEARVKVGDLSARTLSDYRKNAEPLKVFFGNMPPEGIKAAAVQEYLDIGRKAGRPVRANREKACLSSCLSWLMRRKDCPPTLRTNPCMQASGTQGNPETKRERYVTDTQYKAVWAAGGTQVRLQRPESDILGWSPAILARDEHTKARILHFQQGKTGVWVKIALTADLDGLIRRAMGDPPQIGQPLVHTRKGDRYTYTGIMAMLTAAIKRANKGRAEADLIPAFGFRDLKGKGATDMWKAGVPIEKIQLLCGHADKATTEKYIKARWSEAATPNEVAIN